MNSTEHVQLVTRGNIFGPPVSCRASDESPNLPAISWLAMHWKHQEAFMKLRVRQLIESAALPYFRAIDAIF